MREKMDFAVLIPTHERNNYLKRSMAFHSLFNVNVYYCDSSKSKYNGVIPSNVIYYHMPGFGQIVKMAIALREIKEDYICLCADDDFVLYSTLKKGLKFFQENNHYTVITGKFFQYNKEFDGKFSYQYKDMHQYWMKNNINDSSIENKIVQMIGNHYQLFWAMHKKRVIKKIFDLSNRCNFSGLINWSEPLISALSCIEGNIKILPDLWGVREKVKSPIRANNYIGNLHRAKIENPELFIKEFNSMKNVIDREYFNGLSDLIIENYKKNQKNNRNNYKSMFLEYVRNKEFRMVYDSISSNLHSSL